MAGRAVGSAELYASIVIPTHDRAETLAISVESALRQTEERIEVVIVGD
ncbi:glycosyltransferase, partial [Lactococcus cremoris]